MKTQTKSILITGASSGIGKYVSGILAHRGWMVWGGYVEDGGDGELFKIHSKNIRPIKIDVTSEESIQNAKRTIEESGAPLDVLFNNAGIAIGGPVEMLPIDTIKKVYEINFFGAVRMAQVFLPLLRASSGRVVNMSSIGAFIKAPFLMPYASSKLALECMSDQLRRELKKQNVKVVIIEPGSLKTPIWKKSLKKSNDILVKNYEILKFYQPAVANLDRMVAHEDKYAKPLSSLKNTIIHAVESKKPKARYTMCRGDMFLKMFLGILPVKAVDWFFEKYLKHG